MNYNSSISEIRGVGEKTASLFKKLNIENAGELINFLPRDYDEFSQPVPISEAVPGEICAVDVRVASIPNLKRIRNLTILNVNVADNSGDMQLTFFNMPYLKNTLKRGGSYIFRGRVQAKGLFKSMEQPKVYSYDEYMKLTKKLQPIYSLTKGLSNNAVSKAVRFCLDKYEFPDEYYTEELLSENWLIDYPSAIEEIHFPESRESLINARRRLVYDEFFAFIYNLRKNKNENDNTPNNFKMFETADTVKFIEALPFKLTKGQLKCWGEIKQDISGEYAMNRLIQGDVGSGKTVVALLSLLLTASNNNQGALMAPTEVLAVQHFETVKGYIEKYGIAFKPVLLIGSMTAKQKKEAYERIESGDANLIIGTHALIQEKVKYKSLALVVTDEQHRFGVKQREALAGKGNDPHLLVMSATPIPRTIAIIMYGDLKISIIDELPAKRLPIKNCVVGANYRPTAYKFIAGELSKKRQAYVICPLLEPSENDELENVVDYSEKLRAALPDGTRIKYLHGKLKGAEKNSIMEEFSKGEIDVLVSTTVIEVGINVPNANVMMVENAERFGLAQLHQLRGRVGRGEYQSYCIFISTKNDESTMKRLEILNHSNDGFHIASEDLKLRGPGDIFGIRQSGDFSFVIGDVFTDADVLKKVSADVDRVFADSSGKYDRIKAHFDNDAFNFVDFRSI